jgi:hypothetical protein
LFVTCLVVVLLQLVVVLLQCNTTLLERLGTQLLSQQQAPGGLFFSEVFGVLAAEAV